MPWSTPLLGVEFNGSVSQRIVAMSKTFVRKFYKHFETVSDPRINRGVNYPLIEIIFLTLCATICGADTYADVERYGKSKLAWLRAFLPFELGIPSHDTISRVFARLDSLEFFACLQDWSTDIAGTLKGQTVALDGKTLRGSFDTQSAKSPLHSVSAFVCGLKMCIGLKAIDAKTNEIPAVQELISMLELEGAVVTADAMHCQKKTVDAIRAKKADYLLTVKGNQSNLESALLDSLVDHFENAPEKMRTNRTQEDGHGRTETREVTVCPVPITPSFAEWTDVKTIGCVHRTRTVNGICSEETEYFITSLPCKVKAIARHLRSHWRIENSLHHILDVTFTEDSSRIRNGTGPEISAAFRRLALNILQVDTSIKDWIRGKRKRCGWDDSALAKVLACFSKV